MTSAHIPAGTLVHVAPADTDVILAALTYELIARSIVVAVPAHPLSAGFHVRVRPLRHGAGTCSQAAAEAWSHLLLAAEAGGYAWHWAGAGPAGQAQALAPNAAQTLPRLCAGHEVGLAAGQIARRIRDPA